MKAKVIFAALFVVLILVGCASATIATPTKTATITPTSTHVPPTSTPTPTPTIWWSINATPLNLLSRNNDEIISIIDQLHPYLCVGSKSNLLLANPTSIEPAMQVYPVNFVEISTLPKPNSGYINEQADNIDKSRTAFAMPALRAVGNLYVKDNKTGTIYQVDFGATTDRPLDWLRWINRDTFIVAQQGYLWTKIVAINVEKQEFEYYGVTSGCPMATPTP
jgi:hypothetical protein